MSTYLVPDRHWMEYWSIESQYYAHLALNQWTVMSWNATLIHYPCSQCRVSLSLAVSATREDIITRHSSLTRWQKVSLSNLKPTQSVSSQSAPSQEDHLLNYWLAALWMLLLLLLWWSLAKQLTRAAVNSDCRIVNCSNRHSAELLNKFLDADIALSGYPLPYLQKSIYL